MSKVEALFSWAQTCIRRGYCYKDSSSQHWKKTRDHKKHLILNLWLLLSFSLMYLLIYLSIFNALSCFWMFPVNNILFPSPVLKQNKCKKNNLFKMSFFFIQPLLEYKINSELKIHKWNGLQSQFSHFTVCWDFFGW